MAARPIALTSARATVAGFPTLGANTFTGDQTLGVSNKIIWGNQGSIGSGGDGIITLLNNAGTGFSRLQLGGTTSSFPAIKRSGAGFQIVLADDSAYTSFNAGNASFSGTADIFNATAIPAGGTAGTGYRFSSASNFGIFFGSGAPTLAAAKGSLYLRSDGSTTNDRAYINSNGTTGWTALTTAA